MLFLKFNVSYFISTWFFFNSRNLIFIIPTLYVICFRFYFCLFKDSGYLYNDNFCSTFITLTFIFVTFYLVMPCSVEVFNLIFWFSYLLISFIQYAIYLISCVLYYNHYVLYLVISYEWLWNVAYIFFYLFYYTFYLYF